MRAVIHARTWLLAIICLTALGGCQRITIISFHTDVKPTPDVNELIINLHGTDMKESRRLNNLGETLGLVDLPRSTTTIEISAFGCLGGFIKIINDAPPGGHYPIVSDAVLVTMVKFPGSDLNIKCPALDSDGGVSGEPTGAGGAVDSGSGGSGSGGAGTGGAGTGGAAGGGLGGMLGVGGMDGGTDAAGGVGGGTNDAGPGGADGGTCVAPTGPSPGPSPVNPTPECVDYCNQIIGSVDGGPPLCASSYESVDQCQQYCTRAAWDAGSLNDMKDTMGCRLFSLSRARGSVGSQTSLELFCTSAGPSGGSGAMSCGMASLPPGMCTTFCNALAKICPANASGCLSACQSAPASAPACRFPWLVHAATDKRYCALVDFAGSCLPPGC